MVTWDVRVTVVMPVFWSMSTVWSWSAMVMLAEAASASWLLDLKMVPEAMPSPMLRRAREKRGRNLFRLLLGERERERERFFGY